MTATDLYEHDFVAWTERQAKELRAAVRITNDSMTRGLAGTN